MKRRQFLSTTFKSSGALLLHFNLPAFAQNEKQHANQAFFPNGWLEIDTNNRFTFTLDKVEIGQNVITSLAAILAEELDIDHHLVHIRLPSLKADLDNPAYHPTWGTGGSSSIRRLWLPLRHAGASTRAIFLEAAARQFQLAKSSLKCKNGIIYSSQHHEPIRFADLIANVRQLSTQQLKTPQYQLKQPGNFNQLGKTFTRRDAQQKVTGTAMFGIDVQLPEQKYATLIRSPMLGGKLQSVNTRLLDEKTNTANVLQLDNTIAVIADSFWQAESARKLVKAQWQKQHPPASTMSIEQQLRDNLKEKGQLARKKGSIQRTSNNLKASYSVPLLAHAPLEPMNCTVWFHDGLCEIWAPTQRPPLARKIAQQITGYAMDKIIVHRTFIGGGFGRRLSQDYVTEAVSIAMHVSHPLTLIWSREDDMRHGNFRPAATCSFDAAFTPDGKILSWQHKVVALSHTRQVSEPSEPLTHQFMRWLTLARNRWQGKALSTNGVIEGAAEIPYEIANIEVSFRQHYSTVPIGAWRSVGHSYNAFFVESFIDEVAHHLNADPLNYRSTLLGTNNKRLLTTLETVSESAGWQKPLTAGHFQGVACHECFGSFVAVIIEISVHQQKPKLEKIYCAADCGFIVDPDGLKAQLEGAILFGLTAALYGKIDIEDGRVSQSNFHDYPVLRMNETPEIVVTLLPSEEPPGGAGEIGTPVAAPALANAWFSATGTRVRTLPLLASK